MHTSFLVVDDFYDDAEEVRRLACGLDYPQPTVRTPFPGRNSSQRLLMPNLDDVISTIVGEAVFGNLALDHGRCRISLEGEDAKRTFLVHVDPDAYWAGILYLTRPEFCRGGTELYRHRPTDTDRCPLYPEELSRLGAGSYYEAADTIIQSDSNDPDKWELLTCLSMRFNRLVLMRPWMWHTAGPSFGDSLDNGRLVQLFFFKRR